MLVDAKGIFLSQRTLPKMAQIETVLDETHLALAFAGGFFKLPRKISKKRSLSVKVWGTELEAHEEPLLYSQALSQFLGVECRLVRYSDNSRPLQAVAEGFQPETRFSDRLPLLLLNSESLTELNGRLVEPVGMDRFRGNIIYQGEKAFEEESWKKIKIGSVVFSQPQKCSRCVMINLNSQTGEKKDAEPLKTLSEYRREGTKVYFGVQWIPENAGVISLRDSLEVLE